MLNQEDIRQKSDKKERCLCKRSSHWPQFFWPFLSSQRFRHRLSPLKLMKKLPQCIPISGVLTIIDTTYIPIDDETHLKTVYPVYYCTVSGCTNSYLGNGASSTVSHTMSSYSYTGNNYHSGSLHYVRYEHSCLQCGRTTGYWDHYSCPGNGHCILPQSVFPVLTDK